MLSKILLSPEEAHKRRLESGRKYRASEKGKAWLYEWNHRPDVIKKKKEFADAHRDENRERINNIHRKERLMALEAYGGEFPKCACCGEERTEFLGMDHINGGGRKHRAKVGQIGRWLKKHNYPKGFRILCHNCNLSLGAYGYCPHHNLSEEKA